MAKKYSLLESLFTEFLGTALLLGAQVGASYQLSGQTDPRGTLIFGIAVVTALALAVAITIGGPVSGGHFNPAVTLALTVTGNSPANKALPYIAAQFLGGVAGVMSANAIWGGAIVNTTAGQTPLVALLLSEVVATAGLVGIIVTMVRRAGGAGLNWLVPSYLLVAVLLTPTGSMANPAVSLGHIFNASLGLSALAPFIGVQILAALVVAFVTRVLTPSTKSAPKK